MGLIIPPVLHNAMARGHFKQEFAEYTGEGVAAFVDTWFSDETQAVIESLLAQLTGKK